MSSYQLLLALRYYCFFCQMVHNSTSTLPCSTLENTVMLRFVDSYVTALRLAEEGQIVTNWDGIQKLFNDCLWSQFIDYNWIMLFGLKSTFSYTFLLTTVWTSRSGLQTLKSACFKQPSSLLIAIQRSQCDLKWNEMIYNSQVSFSTSFFLAVFVVYAKTECWF